MKKTMTIAGTIILLAFATLLPAQGHNHNNGGGYDHGQNPPEYNHDNDYGYNDVREFRGFLVVNERDIRHNSRLGFYFSMGNINFTQLDFMAGPPRRSGIGIIIQKPNGGHAYYRLDKRGARIAERIMNRSHHNNGNVQVEVTGRVNHRQRIIEVMDMQRIRNHHNGNNQDDDGPGSWG